MLRNHLIPDAAAAISESLFHSDTFLNQKNKSKSFFNPRSSESESVRSPKSPFEFGIFSSFGNSFIRRSQNMVNQKSWDHTKVGLSIIDDETNSKSHLLRRQMSIEAPNFCGDVTPPRNAAVFQNTHQSKPDVVFEIGDNTPSEDSRASSSLDSGKNRKSRFGSRKSLGGSPKLGSSSGGKLSSVPPEIEQSEEYTCVTTHGPNPKVVHFLGNKRILNTDDEINEVLEFHPPDDLLKLCRSCNKKLEGEDIYMYRGEEAFCSSSCREQQIEMDEEIEKSKNKASEISDKPNSRSSSSSKDIPKSCSIFFTA